MSRVATPRTISAKLAAFLTVAVTAAACSANGQPTREESPATGGALAETRTDTTGSASAAAIDPDARCYATMVDAPGNLGVFMFGGWPEPEAGGPWQGVSAYRPGRGWSEFADPVSDGGDIFGFDTQSRRGVFVAVGGPTWILDPVTATWEEQPGKAPPAHGTRIAYDAESDRLIAFGGDNFSGPLFDDTWAYDSEAGSWTKMDPPSRPSARSYHAMAYDAQSDRVILFGGSDGSGTALGDTWAYDVDHDRWTRRSKSGGPEGRLYSAMAYDAQSDRVILFGGITGPLEEPLGDTWSFDLDTNTWTELDVTGPSARGWHVMATDRESGSIVLFGGGASRSECKAETWIFEPAAETWSKV